MGLTPEKHDASKGQGSYLKSMKGIENLGNKVDFQINFTVTERNAQEVRDIFDLTESLGAKAIHFFFSFPPEGVMRRISSPLSDKMSCSADRPRGIREIR